MMDDIQATVLPVYFVADQSTSMSPNVVELNDGLTSFLDAIQEKPKAAAKVRFAIIGFSNDARCLLELTDLRELEAMPTLTARGATSYSAAFRYLRQRIDDDVDRLRHDFKVHRPVVFFLSDGEPNEGDPWEAALDQLRDESFTRRPNILAFGIRDAKEHIIGRIATQDGYAFLAARGADAGAALITFFDALTKSVVNAGESLASGNAELVVEPPDQFTKISVGFVT
jgi:uncharacterized protein YegL